jgi:hypothetical protein
MNLLQKAARRGAAGGERSVKRDGASQALRRAATPRLSLSRPEIRSGSVAERSAAGALCSDDGAGKQKQGGRFGPSLRFGRDGQTRVPLDHSVLIVWINLPERKPLQTAALYRFLDCGTAVNVQSDRVNSKHGSVLEVSEISAVHAADHIEEPNRSSFKLSLKHFGGLAEERPQQLEASDQRPLQRRQKDYFRAPSQIKSRP